ncbi:MAG: hypothetical protein ACP5FP_00405 [Desulfuromonadaceae bacterium]
MLTSPLFAKVDIPRGYYAQLEITHQGQILNFGPFVGYYFKPVSGADTSHLEFMCFNTDQFYTDDLPGEALLFRGEAQLTTLPDVRPIPRSDQRITPVFAPDAPAEWLATRPAPQNEFIHFHSTYDHGGATYTGYWLRHDPVRKFTYNMGGRLSEDSPLYHEVEPGSSPDFPAIIEFDRGN